MKLLVWQPIYVLGGGLHILRHMVAALSRHPSINSITLAISKQYSCAELAPLNAGPNLSIIRIDIDTPLAKHAADHDMAYFPWPHGFELVPAPIPKICVFQDTIVLDALGSNATRDYLEVMIQAVKETVQYYDRMIVTSNYTRRRILEIAGSHYTNRIKVIPHIATKEEYDLDHATIGPHIKITLPSGIKPPYLLYLANTAEHKNHETLLIALASRQRRDVPLLLSGYGTEQIGAPGLFDLAHINRINRLIQERGLIVGHDFHSLGYVNDDMAAELLQQATALVMPTRAEGMGLPIHEAIDAGVPVICSNIEVLREHYEGRSSTIHWVDPECPAEIAAAIDDVCNRSIELRAASKGNRGCNRTWDDIAAETLTILREACIDYTPHNNISIDNVQTQGFLYKCFSRMKRLLKKFSLVIRKAAI